MLKTSLGKSLHLFIVFIIGNLVCSSIYAADPMKLSLSDCLEIAIDHQPQLVSARENMNVAKAQLKESEASYLPSLSVSNSYSRSNSEKSGSSNSYGNSASASQLIYDFGRTPASIRQSRENVKIQELNYLSTELSVRLNVKTAYYTVLENNESVRIAKETLENTKLQLKLADNSYRVGKSPKLDVATAQTQMANAELSLVQAINNLEVSIRTLNNAMGLESNTYEDVELTNSPYAIVSTELKGLIASAMKTRPDVLIFNNQREQVKAALLSAQRGHLPTINASGSYSQSGSDFPLNDSWSGGVSMSFTLFNGFKIESQVQEQKANLRGLDADEKKTQQDVQLDVTTNYLNTKSGEEQIKAAQKLVEQAKESLKLATGRYENGLGSILDLTNAQVSYSNAQLSLAQAIYSYQINYAKLQKSLGEK